MEEKERYEWGYNGKFLKYYILDTQTKDELGYEEVFDLLNQQDKKIHIINEQSQNNYENYTKALKENQQLKALLKATEITDIHNELADLQINNEWLESENQQLKQQLQDLPKKIICEISEAIERLSWRKRIYTNWEFDKEQLYKDLDTILKKYGGENESNND